MWMPRLNHFGDAHGGHGRSRLGGYSEAVNLEVFKMRVEDREGGTMGAETIVIG